MPAQSRLFHAGAQGRAVCYTLDSHVFHLDAATAVIGCTKVRQSDCYASLQAAPSPTTFLQFNFFRPLMVHAIVMQARLEHNQRVTHVKLQVACNGSTFRWLTGADGSNEFPTGIAADDGEIHTIRLREPVRATAVRVVPTRFVGWTSFSADVAVEQLDEEEEEEALTVEQVRVSKMAAVECGLAMPCAIDEFRFNHRAVLSALHMPRVPCEPDHISSHAWCAKTSQPTTTTFLQFTLLQPGVLKAIATKGRGDCDQFVRSYWVEVTYRGSPYRRVRCAGGTELFQGNVDQHDPKVTDLEEETPCDAVRLIPVEVHNHCSMRADVMISGLLPRSEGPTGCPFRALQGGMCIATATDSNDYDHNANLLDLDLPQVVGRAHGWSPTHPHPCTSTYVQFNLKTPLILRQILTKGRGDGTAWVTSSFAAEVALNGGPYTRLRSTVGCETFEGNADPNALVVSEVPGDVLCDSVRIFPFSNTGAHCGLRADLMVEFPQPVSTRPASAEKIMIPSSTRGEAT